MALATRFDARDAAGVSMTPAPARSASSLLADTFDAFADRLRSRLDPSSALEATLADRVVLAAWRLQLVTVDDLDAARSGDDFPRLSCEAVRAERSLERALGLFQTARELEHPRWGQASHTPSAVPTDLVDDAFDFGDDDLDGRPVARERFVDESEFEPGFEADDEPTVSVRWQDRLVFDLDVSETSPVVKGTWVTVGRVVSMIVDGSLWADVLRSHPELTEDDVRTCLAYTVEHDLRGGD